MFLEVQKVKYYHVLVYRFYIYPNVFALTFLSFFSDVCLYRMISMCYPTFTSSNYLDKFCGGQNPFDHSTTLTDMRHFQCCRNCFIWQNSMNRQKSVNYEPITLTHFSGKKCFCAPMELTVVYEQSYRSNTKRSNSGNIIAIESSVRV